MFWNNRRVFVTGHTGFKGAWLCLWLEKLGARVAGFALPPPTQPSLFDEARVADILTSHSGDLRNLAALQTAMQQSQPEVVIHMAAQSLVRTSYADPVGTYSTNVMGTVHLLEAARFCPSVRAIVIVTSDKCYENQEWAWPYRESDRLGGYDPYSNSKACAELVTSSYVSAFFHPDRYQQHHVAIASARAGNVIGGGDWATDRLVPDAVRAFSADALLHIRNPNAVRPWQHVLEPLRGYLTLAQSLVEHGTRCHGAWNFGPHPAAIRPVAHVMQMFAAQWVKTANKQAGWSTAQSDVSLHPHEARFLALDCSKSRLVLGWDPVLSLEDSLELTASWYARFFAGVDAKELTLAQMEHYDQLVARTV